MKQYAIIFYIIILFFNSQKVTSQEADELKSYIPNIQVAAPQVASMSKVSEIPVDISTGRINYMLPIFEVKEGDFNMPINLSYNYSGLLVDETPGYAGVGWTFNIAGAIMHIIKGLDDEEHQLDRSFIYKYFNKITPYQDENDPQSKAKILDLYEKISAGKIDGRPDKYTVNIGDINCSFYLDKDDNPIFLKNENYKLVKNASAGFTLTDDKGINYVFSLQQIGQNASSSSEGYSYNSSFLITEINFPYTANKITFEYAAPDYLYDTYNNYTSVNTVINYYNSWSATTSKTETSTSMTKLSKINTNNYTIELQYENNPTEAAVSVITKLEIKNKAGYAVKTYDFEYSPWSGRRRNLLSLKYNGQVMNTMEYDGDVYPAFSEIDLAKKDLWGYYNATGSLPLTNAPLNPLDNPGIKPDFSSTKTGSLKKITYATKGYSLIEYEPNSVFMNLTDYNLPYPSDSNVSTIFSATTTNNGVTQQRSFEITSVPVTLNLYNRLSNDTQQNGCCERLSEVMFYKEGEESNPILYRNQLWTKDGNWLPMQTSFINQTTVTIDSPGTYILKAVSNVGSMSHITTTLQQSQPSFNQTVGGIRVKEVKNCDFNDSCITTTYNYLQSGNSTGILLQNPKFYSGSFFTDRRQCPPADGDISTRTYYYSYNSIAPLSNFRGSPVLYKVVGQSQVNGNDNNGKTVFAFSGNAYSVNFLHDEGFHIGQLNEKNIITKSGDTIQKQKNTYQNNIKPDNRNFVLGLECKPIRVTYVTVALAWPLSGPAGCYTEHLRPLTDFVTETFTHESENYFLEKQENTSYFNGEKILQSTFNTYNADTGNLKSQTSTNSQGQSLETRYFYPTDSVMINRSFVNELKDKNIVGVPLDTQTYNGTIKLSEQLTVYDKSESTSEMLLPKNIYVAKFPNTLPAVLDNRNLEKKITFDQYDDKGNILQYTLESGTPVSIIWGYYKTQPIAKIENATYSQVSSFVSNLQTLSETGTEADLLLALTALRNDSAMVNALLTSYTYIPIVGVSTITDPKGDKMTYTYDSLGRLEFIKDKNLNVLQKYCYNYKGEQINCDTAFATGTVYQSIARSGSFTKNNCTAGEIGSSVSYTQALGAVTSAVSQADADANGLVKFNTDGQANANTNGICTTPPPSVPTGLIFTSATATSLNFSWTAVAGAVSYKIYKNGVDTGITSATNTGSLSGLTASTAYSIQVMAVNASGNSALSTAVLMTTAAAAITSSCSLNFSRVSGTCTLYKNGSGYLTRSTSGTSNGTLTTGDTFYVTVNATTTYYKGITITSSVRGVLYNYALSKTGSSVTSLTFTKTGSEIITIDCSATSMLD